MISDKCATVRMCSRVDPELTESELTGLTLIRGLCVRCSAALGGRWGSPIVLGQNTACEFGAGRADGQRRLALIRHRLFVGG